jgi:hypothetical protein
MKYVRCIRDGWVHDATPALVAHPEFQVFECEGLPPERIEDMAAFQALQAANVQAKRPRAAKAE